MNELTLYAPPELAPELREQVERLVDGPLRLPGVGDDPGLVLAPSPAIYHPAAQQEADTLRAAFERPADPQAIRLWAQTLAAGHGNAPRTEVEFALWVSALVFTCGDDIPAVVWDAVTLRQASRTFRKYWPNAGEVFELLEARAAQLKREIDALDAIAKGQRERPGPAREAFGYDPGPAPPERAPHPSMPKHDPGDDLVRIDQQSVDAQLAALGFTREQLATGLDEVNARRRKSAKADLLPVNTNEPEGGGPAAKPKRKRRLEVVR